MILNTEESDIGITTVVGLFKTLLNSIIPHNLSLCSRVIETPEYELGEPPVSRTGHTKL